VVATRLSSPKSSPGGLNRRLPEITARHVLPSVLFGIRSSAVVPTDLTRVETFPGAACLKRFPVMDASKQRYRGRLLRAKAAPLQDLHRV
jgi:hypothetical protein